MTEAGIRQLTNYITRSELHTDATDTKPKIILLVQHNINNRNFFLHDTNPLLTTSAAGSCLPVTILAKRVRRICIGLSVLLHRQCWSSSFGSSFVAWVPTIGAVASAQLGCFVTGRSSQNIVPTITSTET
jgi:hypothetical protein